jgi:hypothetical protein
LGRRIVPHRVTGLSRIASLLEQFRQANVDHGLFFLLAIQPGL